MSTGTRRWIAALLLAVVASASASASASAATSSVGSVYAISGGGKVLSLTQVDFTATGAITVSFHGDSAAGCAARGVCAYRGTIVAPAPSPGSLTVIRVRLGHRVRTQTTIFGGLSGPGGPGGPVTTAQVDRALAGEGVARCADAVTPSGLLGDGSIRRGAFTLRLLSAGTPLLATRCAGPTDGALAPFSPRITLPLGPVLRGRKELDLSATHSFSAEGFAGTVSSTVVLHLGAPSHQAGAGRGQFPPGVRLVRTRIVTERLRVTRVTGRLQARAAGVADPAVCSLLDSCGLAESITLAPTPPRSAQGELFVSAPARLPYARFLGALGLVPGRGSPTAAGGAGWTDSSRAAVAASQDGAGCHATGPSAQDFLSLRSTGGRLTATFGTNDSVRAACPGPFLGGQTGSGELAIGSVPLSALRRRTFTIHLGPAPPITDDGT